MISTPLLAPFLQWLLASPAPRCASRTIVLHGGSNEIFDPLIRDIASYLNEYDEDGAGRWLAATSEMVAEIATNPESLRLLEKDHPSANQLLRENEIPEILTALGQRGHVILRHDAPEKTTLNLPEAFHAGIGDTDCGCAKCHLVLNPELVQPQSLAHIVSDVFLDWHDEDRRRSLPETTRNAMPSAIREQTGASKPASV